MTLIIKPESTDELLFSSQKKILIHGVEFEEEFLSGLIVKHLS